VHCLDLGSRHGYAHGAQVLGSMIWVRIHGTICVNARILGAMDSAVAEGPERSRMGMRCPWTAAEEPRIRTWGAGARLDDLGAYPWHHWGEAAATVVGPE
jgi:hypothetical protein